MLWTMADDDADDDFNEDEIPELGPADPAVEVEIMVGDVFDEIVQSLLNSMSLPPCRHAPAICQGQD